MPRCYFSLSAVLYFPPFCFHCFFHFSQSVCPPLSHPVISPHCSHLSIYAYFCHVLRSPLTLCLFRSLSLCFPTCTPPSFFCSTSPTHSVFLFLANHYSFSFVSSDAAALFCRLKPLSPSFLTPCSSFLSRCAAPVAGWGGRLGASLLQTLCWDVMLMVVLPMFVCVCLGVRGETRGFGMGVIWLVEEGDGLSFELTMFDRQQRMGGVAGRLRWLDRT